ncbi:MAG: ANTAR domain-containing protein [Firmicutes bacterium]|nr:ANTAR domain-containing protein [Bacillota bacterium]
MDRYSILVADSSETSRKLVINLLKQKGYKVYKATDGAGALRIARSIFPDLALIDINLWGIKAYEIGKIIEEDGLSTVVYMIRKPDDNFFKQLKNMNLYAYINKPVNSSQFYQTIEFSLMNLDKIKSLEKKVENLENTLKARKLINRAKGLIMENLDISENEAYKLLRSKSMDKCISMEKMAQKIINKYLPND